VATTNWYGLAHKDQWGSGTAVSWTADSIKVALTTNSYSPNQDTDEFFTTPVAFEITGTGYTARGTALTGKSLNYASAANEAQLLASNASWASATFTAYYAVVYKDTGVNGTSVLMGYVSFGAAQAVSSGTFTIQWDATGVLKVVAA
jgi:hypothetical protein